MGSDLYEIAGVAGPGFTGTEPGTFIDIFVPDDDAPGRHPCRLELVPAVRDAEAGRCRGTASREVARRAAGLSGGAGQGWTSQTKLFLERFLNQTLLLEPAPSGVSSVQTRLSHAR